MAFHLQSTSVTYSLLCQCFTPDVFIDRCCKDLLQLALALLSRYFVYMRDTLQVLSFPSFHLQSTNLPTKESITSSSLSPQPTSPASPTPLAETTTTLIVDLLYVRLFSSPYR